MLISAFYRLKLVSGGFMKGLLSIFLVFVLLGCSEQKKKTPKIKDGNDTGHLSKAEMNSFLNTQWCENGVAVSFIWVEDEVKKSCVTQVTAHHNITQFTTDEFLVELSYQGEDVICQPMVGTAKSFSQDNVTMALMESSYRMSFTDENLASVTKVGDGKKSAESEILITEQDIKIIPVEKNLKPRALYNCN